VAHIEMMKNKNTISVTDSNLFLVTDSVDEAVAYLKQYSIQKFNLRTEKPYKPFKWLFEK
jgi:hypothetical protein